MEAAPVLSGILSQFTTPRAWNNFGSDFVTNARFPEHHLDPLDGDSRTSSAQHARRWRDSLGYLYSSIDPLPSLDAERPYAQASAAEPRAGRGVRAISSLADQPHTEEGADISRGRRSY